MGRKGQMPLFFKPRQVMRVPHCGLAMGRQRLAVRRTTLAIKPAVLQLRQFRKARGHIKSSGGQFRHAAMIARPRVRSRKVRRGLP